MQLICADWTNEIKVQGSGLSRIAVEDNPWRLFSPSRKQQLIVTSLGYCSAIASSNAPIAGGATGGEIRGGDEKKKEKKKAANWVTRRGSFVQPCPPHRVSRLPVDGS